MNTYIFTKNNIIFKFRYDKNVIQDIKALLNETSYNKMEKTWSCRKTQFNIDRLDYLFKMYGFIQADESKEFPWEELKKISVITESQLQAVKDYAKDYGFKLTPRDYQLYGVASMLNFKSCINGDAMGLGKTGQSIMSIEMANLKPALIITPASLKYNWQKEWNKWVDGANISVIDGKHKDFDADIVIINYDLLNKNSAILKKKKWASMVLDESQFIKNSKSQRSKVVRTLAKNIEYKFLLTGTAIMNRVDEIIHPLKVLNLLDSEFGGWKKFIFKYCDAHYGNYGLDITGASNILELNSELRKTCYIRRELSDVLDNIPERVDQIIEVPFTNRGKLLSIANDVVSFVEKTEGLEASLRAELAIPLVTSIKLKQYNSIGKQNGIKAWIKDFKESSDDKLLIFGCNSNSLQYLSSEFKSVLIDGSVSSKNKLKYIEDFQKSDEQLLFGNIQSLGTGVDGLQEVCSYVLFIDLPDVPSLIDQAIARLRRSGQKKVVNVYYAFAKGGIDKLMWDILSEKYEIVDAINKGDSKRISESNKKFNMNQTLFNTVRNGEF